MRDLGKIFLFLVLPWGNVFAGLSTITDAKSIAAYGEDGAYMINDENELYMWDTVALHWEMKANITPAMRQMDILNDGSGLIGTDEGGVIREWSHVPGPGSLWTTPHGSTQYDWVMYDHVSDETRALSKIISNGWITLDTPVAGGSWDEYLPSGEGGTDKMATLWFVGRDAEKFKKWERGNTDYVVKLNRQYGSIPFYIYYYGDDEAFAIDRIEDPPLVSHYIDDVVVKQMSYDEENQNLWCIDENGVPWQWDNVDQDWIRRDARSEEVLPLPDQDIRDLFRRRDDYYVRTTYIQGEYKPVVIVFADTYILHLIIGELSRSDLTQDTAFTIVTEPRRDHKFDHVLLRPKETPQKIVRIDGGKRIRENGYLETLLIEQGIIANADAISVYPAEHRLIRR